MITKTGFAAIRRCVDDGREWLDVGTITVLREQTGCFAKKEDDIIPSWVKSNPVVRIVRIEIRELED